MLLAIDVGNTETVIGLFSLGPGDDPPAESRAAPPAPPEPAGLTHHWRLSTVAERTPDEQALLLTELLDLDGMDVDEVVTGMAVTSSVPRVTTALRQMAGRWFDVPCVVLEPGVRSGMPILYDNPKEVGADRIANAIGAYDLYGGPCIVVDLGTATTFDAISAQGRVPRRRHRARASPSRWTRCSTTPPRCAGSSWSSRGASSGSPPSSRSSRARCTGTRRRSTGCAGASSTSSATPRSSSTGGCPRSSPRCRQCIEHREPWLTLHGLRLVYERNSKPG